MDSSIIKFFQSSLGRHYVEPEPVRRINKPEFIHWLNRRVTSVKYRRICESRLFKNQSITSFVGRLHVKTDALQVIVFDMEL